MGVRRLAVVGDNFITTSSLVRYIKELDVPFKIREKQYSWPDEPMHLVPDRSDLDGIREYVGTPEEVVEVAQSAEIFVNHLAPVSEGVLESLPDLKMIVVTRGGAVNVDIAAVAERGIRLVNMPGRNASAVAEFTIGLMLAETRHIRCGHEALRAHRWRGDLYRLDTAGRELNELTIGIIGYGNVGARVVSLLLAFGARILVHDPFKPLEEDHSAAGVEQVDLDRLLSESNLVSIHSRLQDDGANRFDRGLFSRMHRGAILINTARGVMVDYSDLHAALCDGTLLSAALDTFDNEPPIDSPILDLPNVTLTPHLAGSSQHTVELSGRMAAEEIRRYLKGEEPLNPLR